MCRQGKELEQQVLFQSRWQASSLEHRWPWLRGVVSHGVEPSLALCAACAGAGQSPADADAGV